MISSPILTPSIVDEDWSVAPVPMERGSNVETVLVAPVPVEGESNVETVLVTTSGDETNVTLVEQPSTDVAHESTPVQVINEQVESLPEEEQLGRGCRERKPSVLLKDYVTYTASCDPNTHTSRFPIGDKETIGE